MKIDPIHEVLEEWGAYEAKAIPGLGARRMSVEGRMMKFGTMIDRGQSSNVPGYFPPRYKAILAAKRIIAELPQHHKSALEIRYVLNLDERAVSKRTGATVRSVEKRNNRARAAFRKCWATRPYATQDIEVLP